MKNYFVIGVMSGTSIDGIDLVHVNFYYSKSWTFKILSSKTYKYDKDWQNILKNISDKNLDSIKQIDKKYTKLLSIYIQRFIKEFSSDMPFFYGLFSIMFAITLGVGAALIRRFISNIKKKILAKS